MSTSQCSGLVALDGKRCENTKYCLGKVYYCPHHVEQKGKDVSYVKCSGLNGDGTKCVRGKAIEDDEYYCKAHDYQNGFVYKHISCGSTATKYGKPCQNKGLTCDDKFTCHAHKTDKVVVPSVPTCMTDLESEAISDKVIQDIYDRFEKYGHVLFVNRMNKYYAVGFNDSRDALDALECEANTVLENFDEYIIKYYPDGLPESPRLKEIKKKLSSPTLTVMPQSAISQVEIDTKKTKTVIHKSKKYVPKSVRCHGKTCSGTRCKRRGVVDGVYWCKAHQSQKDEHIARCKSNRADGTRCRVYINEGLTHCHNHKQKNNITV